MKDDGTIFAYDTLKENKRENKMFHKESGDCTSCSMY